MLEEEVSVEIIKHLEDRDIARIHRADTDLGQADESLLREVAQDFHSRLRGGKGGGIAAAQSRRLDSLVRGNFDEERLGEIFGRTDVDIGKLQDTLLEIDPRVIGRILGREYPQTAALVLSQLPPLEAAQILMQLPEDLRVEVMLRITKLEQISEDMLAELNRALSRELSGFEGAVQSQEMVGVDLAVQLLMNMDKTNEATLLESIGDRDPDVAEQIREQMFTFDDLIDVDDRAIQTVLRNIENQTLVLALKGAEEAMQEVFLRNVSKRVSESLREDLETMGPVRLSEVEGAQQQIANAARELADRGEIQIGGRTEDEYV